MMRKDGDKKERDEGKQGGKEKETRNDEDEVLKLFNVDITFRFK